MKDKEKIFFAILCIICLEQIRKKHNRLEDEARKENWSRDFLQKKQNLLLILASLAYGIFLSFIILNFIISLTYKITSVYPDTSFLKSNTALIIKLIFSYTVSVFVVRSLLPLYIRWMTGFTTFWKKLGRSAWDGTKIVVKTPIKVGGVVKDKVYKSTRIGVGTISKAGTKSIHSAIGTSKYIADKTIKGTKLMGKGLSKFFKRLRF